MEEEEKDRKELKEITITELRDINTLRKLGYGKQLDMIEKNICPYCQQEIDMFGFKTEESVEEYMCTGMCPKCYEKLSDSLKQLANDPEMLEFMAKKLLKNKGYDLKM